MLANGAMFGYIHAMQTKTSFPKDKIKVLLLEGIHRDGRERLEEEGFSVIAHHGAMEEKELRAALDGVHVLGIRSKTHIAKAAFADARRLLAVGAFCIGTNQIDLKAALAAGVPVFNAPFSNTRSVAELVISDIIALFRRIGEKSMLMHSGKWDKSAHASVEVRGKTLGIVGYGHIGSQVSILAEALGMHVVFHDIRTVLPLGNARPLGSLAELLATADVVTLHVPEDEGTRNLISRERVGQLKRGAYLINASRGTVVEIEALAEALASGAVAGAAVDVFPQEPRGAEQRFESPLVGLRNVILTPHVGGSTMEAQRSIGEEVARKLVAFCGQGTTEGAVNVPAVSLPPKERTRRILHLHRNVPGMLRQINKAIADGNINVLGQYLATDPELGYVILDIERGAGLSRQLLEDLAAIEGTIRTRVVY